MVDEVEFDIMDAEEPREDDEELESEPEYYDI